MLVASSTLSDRSIVNFWETLQNHHPTIDVLGYRSRVKLGNYSNPSCLPFIIPSSKSWCGLIMRVAINYAKFQLHHEDFGGNERPRDQRHRAVPVVRGPSDIRVRGLVWIIFISSFIAIRSEWFEFLLAHIIRTQAKTGNG